MGRLEDIYAFAILYFIILINIILTIFIILIINFHFGIDIRPILKDNLESLIVIFQRIIPFIFDKIILFIDSLMNQS